jgi:hypothetical protein
MSNPIKYIDSFLHTLKIVIKEASNLLPNDPGLYRANKRINLIIQYQPKLAFEKVGEMLYRYHKFVYDSSTEDLLLEWNFKEVELLDNEDTDMASLIIAELKLCFKTLNTEQKIFFRKQICDLLDDYLDYQVSIKK